MLFWSLRKSENRIWSIPGAGIWLGRAGPSEQQPWVEICGGVGSRALPPPVCERPDNRTCSQYTPLPLFHTLTLSVLLRDFIGNSIFWLEKLTWLHTATSHLLRYVLKLHTHGNSMTQRKHLVLCFASLSYYIRNAQTFLFSIYDANKKETILTLLAVKFEEIRWGNNTGIMLEC